MQIEETVRVPAPGPEPLGFASVGKTLWVTSREAHRLYAFDAASWTLGDEVATPGAPFGITAVGDEFRVVIGFGDDDDDRYIYRFVPSHGFAGDRIACPDLSGVHLAYDGDALFLSQAHNKKILALDERGSVIHEIALERRPVGMVLAGGAFYLISTNDDWKNHELTKVDTTGDTPVVTSLAEIPFVARGLAFDGTCFWTGARSTNEVVAFHAPGV
jgi:sugar lactone lactonase YvrE